MDGIDLMRSK